jgi:pimeloyl-ACP methyl ester carboxylesterase
MAVGLSSLIERVSPSTAPATWYQISALPIPLLVVRGAHSTTFPSHALADLAERLPAAKLVEIADAHHHVMLDAPQPLAAVMAGFLSEARAQPTAF